MDKLQDRVEKEVSRQHKAIEYDRRFAKTLPNFEMESELRDQVLQVAADLNKQSNAGTAADSTAQMGDNAVDSSSAPEVSSRTSATPATTASGSAAVSGSATPVSVGSSHTSLAMATLNKDLQKLSVNNAGPSASASTSSSSSLAYTESEDKVMARALTTYQILLKLGFSSAQIEDALLQSSSPDVEDCLSYSTLRLTKSRWKMLFELERARLPRSAEERSRRRMAFLPSTVLPDQRGQRQ